MVQTACKVYLQTAIFSLSCRTILSTSQVKKDLTVGVMSYVYYIYHIFTD